MVKKTRGFRSGTRKKLRKKVREKRLRVTKYLQEFKEGDKVCIEIEPASHKGMPHPRFMGRVGIVKGKRGKAYIIEIKNGGKTKTIISKPEHLKMVS
jgi:large subunit ribosomal protein L21e